jgi:hypothetical protein
VAGGLGWWAAKTRRAASYRTRPIADQELRAVDSILAPAGRELFRSMHPADQRHGLAVMAAIKAQGADDPDLLVAALVHDAGKGNTGLVPRIVHSLGQAYGPWIPRLARRLPGLAVALDRLADHPARSAALAARAGCTDRTVELIRWQEEPRDPDLGGLLRLADEAN